MVFLFGSKVNDLNSTIIGGGKGFHTDSLQIASQKNHRKYVRKSNTHLILSTTQ